jgi:hypothetical protein
MIIEEWELNLVYFCENCDQIEIGKNRKVCNLCRFELTEIGFYKIINEAKPKIMGGSIKPKVCGCGNLTEKKGYDNLGRPRYRTNCGKCRYAALKQKGNICANCGEQPERHNLDTDHIDGNRSNNHPSNLQTLCKPCHKEKTKRNKDWKKK